MFSFDKTIKKYDGDEEIEETYSFFIFTNGLTSPTIVKYMNDGSPVQYNMIHYSSDFLGIETSISNVFYFSYDNNGFTENYSIYDGGFLIYENLTQEYSNDENIEESNKFTEIPKSQIEDELKIELKTVHTQRAGNYNAFDTYYYCNGNMNTLNLLRINYNLPKELQISSWKNPQKITESEFLELVSNYDDEEDNNILYEIVSNDDKEILYYKILSYINNNLIILEVDYKSIGKMSLSGSGGSLMGLFNSFQNASRNRVKRYSNSRVTFFSNITLYDGTIPSTSSHDNITMSTTYDGYSSIKSFYPNNNNLWNGGYLQDYVTFLPLLSGFDLLGYEDYSVPNYIKPEDFCVLWENFSVTGL